jgi:hypothetical protein
MGSTVDDPEIAIEFPPAPAEVVVPPSLLPQALASSPNASRIAKPLTLAM